MDEKSVEHPYLAYKKRMEQYRHCEFDVYDTFSIRHIDGGVVDLETVSLSGTLGSYAKRALMFDEFSLRVAHDANPFATVIARRKCTVCLVVIPLNGLFLEPHYYCIDCVTKRVLPDFCAYRIWLLRQCVGDHRDIAELEARILAYLCIMLAILFNPGTHRKSKKGKMKRRCHCPTDARCMSDELLAELDVQDVSLTQFMEGLIT